LRAGTLNEFLNARDRIDDVLADPFFDFDGNRRIAIEAQIDTAVEKCTAYVGDVLQRDHAVAADLDWQAQYVLRAFDEARHLNGEAAAACINVAGGDQLVVGGDDAKQVATRHPEALKARLIDDDFEHFFALTGEVYA
jgi:hypothetical protein